MSLLQIILFVIWYVGAVITIASITFNYKKEMQIINGTAISGFAIMLISWLILAIPYINW